MTMEGPARWSLGIRGGEIRGGEEPGGRWRVCRAAAGALLLLFLLPSSPELLVFSADWRLNAPLLLCTTLEGVPVCPV